MNKVLQRDILSFASVCPLAQLLAGSSILLTGATGLIGSIMAKCLLALNRDITILAPVRNKGKALTLFSDVNDEHLHVIECDLATADYATIGDVDYIIHCAAPTSSRFFVTHPVETYRSIHDITLRLLDYAATCRIKGMVYLSSLEVYGTISNDDHAVTEHEQGYLDPLSVRSSYPMAKRATESLCHLYAMQHGVPVTIARLTQTTGAGIAADDNRIIAQFARLAAAQQDIVLHTTGESARPYCYTIDAISAIIHVLLRGEKGEAYNVANEETYISARGMAEFLQQNFAPSISVRVELNDNMGYAPATKLRLSTSKLQSLGWKPHYGLKEIFLQLMEYLAP